MTDLSTIETIRGWASTGALGGLLGIASHLWLKNRKLSMQSRVEDRQGYGVLIESLTKRLTEQDERILQLEQGRDKDHRLIVTLLGQLNRNQAAAILTSQQVSPELRAALESTMGNEAILS